MLAHGHVPLEEYTNGATMLRERDYLARQGYVTLHIDYRNHAQSGDDPDNGANLRVGYAIDAINAGLALQQFESVDPDRVGIIGRSMGGGVVYGAVVAKPGLFKSGRRLRARELRLHRQLQHVDAPRQRPRERRTRDHARLGTPEESPETWALTSPRTYFDRITDPILIHHGTADESCPIEWSERPWPP